MNTAGTDEEGFGVIFVAIVVHVDNGTDEGNTALGGRFADRCGIE